MTNRKKDLFDLFREQEPQLSSSPSPRAWRNLEARLDSRRRRNRLSTVRNLSMAAALLLIAVVATVLALSADQDYNRRINQSPIASESLPAAPNGAAEELHLAVSAQRAQQNRRQHITEGDHEQKLVPATLRDGAGSSNRASLTAISWLSGQWQTRLGTENTMMVWKTTAPNILQGTLAGAEPQELLGEVQIREAEGTLFLATDIGQGEMMEYRLSKASAQLLQFEKASLRFPQRVTLRREGMNHFVLVYDNPARAKDHPSTLSNKPLAIRFERLQLQ